MRADVYTEISGVSLKKKNHNTLVLYLIVSFAEGNFFFIFGAFYTVSCPFHQISHCVEIHLF